MLNKGRPCQGMTNTIRIKAIVPETVADDIVYYADDSGIYSEGNELAVEALRTMLRNVSLIKSSMPFCIWTIRMTF